MIRERVKEILRQIPQDVQVVAATKTRSPEEIEEAIKAGITIIGENYVQEAERKQEVLGKHVCWHLIGHLQKNKVKKAVKIFDLIETLDSLPLAEMIEKECNKINKQMPVFVEINIAKESQKSGIREDELMPFLEELLSFRHLSVEGLMTMGPWVEDAEFLRPYFKRMKRMFEEVRITYRDKLPNFRYLSMGMSTSFKVAIQEGANIIRLGTILFGTRREE